MRFFTLMLCLTVMSPAIGQVSPLLSTTWDQTCNYNANCPNAASGGACGKVFTGCGATAMAQVMKFWSHPSTGWGSHSYTPSGYPLQTANFGTTTYNFASMPNNLSGANAAVAQLMHHCGISVDMQYSGTSSNSSFSDLRDALKEYFRYSLTTHNEMKWAHTDSSWAELIKSELDAGRPVLFSGSSHFWVVDGYQYAPALQFHMNWGWGGTYNGWYALNDLTPGSLSFPNSSVIVGIKPALPFEMTPDTFEVSHFASTFNQYEISTEFAFTATTSDSWINIDSASGTVGYHKDNFDVTANNSYFERWGYIVITAGVTIDTIVVHQAGHPSGLDLSTDTLFYTHTGGIQGVDIYCSTSWNITPVVAWATPGSTSGSGLTNVNITVAANSGAQRTHTYSATNGTFTKTLVLVQEASPTAGMKEETIAVTLVYPNPATQRINVIGVRPGTLVVITDMIGRQVWSGIFNGTEMDISSLNPGLYTVTLNLNGFLVETRFIKTNL